MSLTGIDEDSSIGGVHVSEAAATGLVTAQLLGSPRMITWNLSNDY